MTNEIQKILNERKITQADLADVINVNSEYMGKIIRGVIEPKAVKILRIARALNTPVEAVFFLETSDML